MNKILGVKIDNLDKKNLFQKIENFLEEKKFHQISTINPEFILEAQKNEKFRNVLNACDLGIADGIGIWFAFLRKDQKLKTRIAGIDLMEKILEFANQKSLSIFLIANENGLSTWEETRDVISRNYPNLEINGINLNKEDTGYKIQDMRCDILFCNFGAPHQELFLNSLKNANIRLAMGVGGGFDFLTGKIKRAPVFMRKLGLEWLWRLKEQPRHRFIRILKAVVIFPIKVLFNF
jgi:N-acetylglucosaminyldiphosphoundecaprenol N-acetyl-beta-D-mannosaminyltransferase